MSPTEGANKPDWNAMMAAALPEAPKEEFDISAEIEKADRDMPINDNQTMLFSSWLDSLDNNLRAELANEPDIFFVVKQAFRQGIRLQRPPSERPFAVLIAILEEDLGRHKETIHRLSSGDVSSLESKGDDTFYDPASGKLLNSNLAQEQIVKLTSQIEIAKKYNQRFSKP